MEIERTLPDINDLNSYYQLFFEDYEKEGSYTIDDYLSVIKKYEMDVEDYFNELFKSLGIQSTVKTDRYSLPYNNEIIHIQEGKMNLYQLFNLREFARVVIGEFLNKKIEKLRFYVTGDVLISRGKETKIVLKFRYFK